MYARRDVQWKMKLSHDLAHGVIIIVHFVLLTISSSSFLISLSFTSLIAHRLIFLRIEQRTHYIMFWFIVDKSKVGRCRLLCFGNSENSFVVQYPSMELSKRARKIEIVNEMI